MNFTPFGVPFSGSLPVSAQFTTNGKFPQNINGQVVGVLQGGEGGVHYLRPVESASGSNDQNNCNNQAQAAAQQMANLLSPTLITLPITMPGAKPGDPQQTVQIQVIAGQPQPKYQVAPLPIHSFQQQGNGQAVLTVAYNGEQQNGVLLADGSQGLPEGVTVVAALQPHDLQLLQAGATLQAAHPQDCENNGEEDEDKNSKDQIMKPETVNIKTEIMHENDNTIVNDYLQRMQNNSLINQYLKFTAETIKRESQIECSPLGSTPDNSMSDETQLVVSMDPESQEGDQNAENGEKGKKRKKYKKQPKPKKPKPGQVLIATALDGTTLFCCPECHMAYPEKELLEQHLIGHKIERRFICHICGAGLKRKEHLERHKLGHSPDRPFICSVCLKGFKRKEHLNLHYVIHSGEKTEVCGECGKGFYRKDHLRKHARSHAARRLKEEMQQAQAKAALQGQPSPQTTQQQQQQQQQPPQQQQPQTQQHHLTIQVSNEAMEAMGINPNNVPNNQIQLPVQIQVPQHHLQIGNSAGDGDVNGDDSTDQQISTVVLPSAAETTQIQVPVQIQVPQHHLVNNIKREINLNGGDNNSTNDQQISTVVLPTAAETGAMAILHQATTNTQQQH
ncbi:transcription factor Sp1-like [Chrysoperla carnea]|uniref:transcription factor Sp1-like n=1 Tax=Chrysoperla carnea TaxID=189513 RepID=UPI001D07811F|nr:transcription factor Sp1-like [Chrysoperla carnea]